MNRESRVMVRWTVVVAAAIALVAAGAGATYLLMRRANDAEHDPGMSGMPSGATSASKEPQASGANSVPANTSAASLPDVVVTLSKEAIERAGIELTPVTEGSASSGVRIPGSVEPNAYRQVVVTPVVSGRVTRVLVELGTHVSRGQTLAQVFSPELAEAETRYVSARAELEAHERELERTTKLVEIGAASRQELERVHAEHTAAVTSVQSLRSRLTLLGLSASAIDALSRGREVDTTTNIPAPFAGTVTERDANVGLNVDTSTKLFTVVDLSSVWVVGALYEKDFSRVRVGNAATVTTTAYPGLALRGRVSYIDPQVSPETRTAPVRVEVPNPRLELRLGMFADIQVADPGHSRVALVPRAAVQTVGDRQVVYLVNPNAPGNFTEREVRLGESTGDQVEVISGVQPGDVIVSKGSFFVRAERERLGLRPTAPPRSDAAPGASAPASSDGAARPTVQTARIIVGEHGYEPSQVTVRAGVPARITFVRTTDKTCGTAVVFASLNIRRELPLNQPVDIEFTPQKSAEIQFVCGVNMLRGSIVVQ